MVFSCYETGIFNIKSGHVMKNIIRGFIVILVLTVYQFGYAQTNIAVLPLRANNISAQEAAMLTDRLNAELFYTEKFVVVEREMMEEILREQNFQLSGCTTNECLVEVGKLLGVEQMVGGSVSYIDGLYTISARLISVERGKVVQVATYDQRGDLSTVLTAGIKHIAQELANSSNTGNEASASAGLQITTTPPNALVTIDSTRKSEKSPVFYTDLTPGVHSIRIEMKGFLPYHDTVNLEANEVENLEIELSEIQRVKESRSNKILSWSLTLAPAIYLIFVFTSAG